jgi:hypothetical protein
MLDDHSRWEYEKSTNTVRRLVFSCQRGGTSDEVIANRDIRVAFEANYLVYESMLDETVR